jgi:hypothetical protein
VDLTDLLAVLDRDGLLLMTDASLPSLVALVAGGPIGGSWWGHPRGGEIYHLANALAHQPDVMLVKLVAGKKTFVHRRLWPAVVAVGQARERWQLDGLSEAYLALLAVLDDVGRLAWDEVPPLLPPSAGRPTEAVNALESRLLIHTSELHTPSGAHARNLETWSSLGSRVGITPPLPSVADGKRQLEFALAELEGDRATRARLPWLIQTRSQPVRTRQWPPP